jgi:hypothetical protein
MQITRRLLVLTTVVFAATVIPAQAQATRTWVSGVGDDVNPCSRTAPCKTFAGAISKTATDGVISVLDPGGYGAVTITKGITIDGGGIEGSILSAGVNGIVISSPSGSGVVTLRNLSIYGTGTGLSAIRVIGSVNGVHVEHCFISGHTAHGIDFEPSSGTLFVNHSQIVDSDVSGVLVIARQAVLDDVQLAGNQVGVRAHDSALVTIRRSSITGSSFAGMNAHNGSVIAVTDSSVSQNVRGLQVTVGGEIVVGGDTIVGNSAFGMVTDGSGFLVSNNNNTILNATDFGPGASFLILPLK